MQTHAACGVVIRIRVLYVNHVSQVSGAERTLLDLLSALPRSVERRLACPGPEEAPLPRAARDRGVDWVPLRGWRPHRKPPWRLLADLLGYRGATRNLLRVVEESSPDLLHANSLPTALLAMGCRNRPPVLWHARDLRLPEHVVRVLLAQVDRVIAISQCVAERLVALAPGEKDKIAVVYNGVDLAALDGTPRGDDVLESLGVPTNRPLVGIVAQLVPWKRLDVFLNAAGLVAKVCEAHFVVLGADLFGEHRCYGARLKAHAERLGLKGRVHWLGWREDAWAIVRSLKVYLHTADSEPLGRAILEAMALRVPCVAPGACGPAEIIEDGVTGLLFPPGSATGAAEACLRLLGDTALAEEVARRARCSVEERFNAHRMAEEMVREYQLLVGRGHDSPV